MKTIHIIPSKHHQELREYLLETSPLLLNTEVLDFNIAFKTDQNKHELLVKSYHLLSTLNLDILTEVIRFPKTTELIISMCKELKLYQIDLNTLPTDSSLDRDLKLCLETLYPLINNPFVENGFHYVAYNHGLSHAEHHYLKANAIEVITLPEIEPTKVSFHNALNPRQELEGAIQDLIMNQYKDVSFVIPNLKSQIPMIETSFKRYGIDISLQDRNFLVVKKQFMSLINYALNLDIKNLLSLIELNVFNLSTYRELHYIIENYGMIEHHENEAVQKILDKTHEDQIILQENLSTFSNLTLKEALIKAYEILMETQNHDLKPLKSFIEKSSQFYSLDTKDLLMEAIENIPVPSLSHESIHIYDLNDFHILPREKVYALMLTAQNYPAIRSNSGIFEESYLRRIPGYPTLEERTRYALQNKSHFLRKSNNLTLSYAIANYEGKPQTPSFAIENFVSHHASAWKLSEIEDRRKKPKKISPEIAQALYTDKGIITTSVSALQLYVADPYQYYIEKGLKLREPEFPVFDARNLGVINHKIMENYHQNIQSTNLWIEPFEEIVALRNQDLMKRNIEIIKEGQAVTVLETSHTEFDFKDYPLFKNFRLNGIIDRIDTSDYHLMIVDYKSTATSLSPTKFLQGEQLQLLTYGLIATQLLQKKLFSVYNYGFNHTNINTIKYKYSAASGITEVNESISEQFIKSKQYEGWIFDELNDLFTSADYHKGIKELKNGLKVSPKPYVTETVMTVLENVYQSIYKNITSGIIDKNEIEIIDQSEIKLKEALNDNTI